MKLTRISAIWCTSCILTHQDWVKLKEEHSDYSFEELDYDTDDIEEYNIGDILPVIIVEKDNKEITRIIGEKRKKDIDKVLEEIGSR